MTASVRLRRCLVFTSDSREAETVSTLASALGERGTAMTLTADADECFDLLVTCPWDFLIVDASGDGDASFDLLANATRACPGIPALALVRRGEIATTVHAMKAGAADCIETPVTTTRLLSVIESLSGQEIRRRPGPYANLTRTERVVLQHVLNGRTSRQIAVALCRSPRTIHVHRRNIMAKLGAANLIDLVKLERAG
ncbi:MAG: LuxR C-terminal-related transcriptional regulator [Phycisphaerales bacterium]